jgi:hypothetical protein
MEAIEFLLIGPDDPFAGGGIELASLEKALTQPAVEGDRRHLEGSG